MSDARERLAEAGIEIHPDRPLPFLKVDFTSRGQPLAPGAVLKVQQGELETEVELPGIAELFRGDAPAPDLSAAPTEELAILFATLEGAFADFCEATGRQERDREMQRIYRRLRDRPDGSDRNPLFGHLRGALRLYMCQNDLSEAQYDAVLERLIQSVRRWAVGKDSVHYLAAVRQTLAQLAEQMEKAQAEATAAAEDGSGEESPPGGTSDEAPGDEA